MTEKKLRIAIPAPEADIGSYQNYFNAMRELGAEPVLVGVDCDAAGFDGLLLPGGGDVDPKRYGEENTACGEIDDALDDMQFAVLDAFVKLRKPVIGICRGHQLLNVYFGGSLIQHIDCAEKHARDKGSKVDKVHAQTCEAGSFLAGLYGTEFATNSSHHQAVKRIAEHMHAVMHSPEGIIEALYHDELPVWSVQWHPERMCFAHKRDDTVDGSKVLGWFLEQCEG